MGVDDDLAAVAAELYALPPQDFTPARDAAAKAADGPLRAAVKALRRPTASAWLVNRLARDEPELLDSLLALGPALAQAQSAGSGDELRALGQQRRELVQAVTGTAVVGHGVSTAVRTEVEQTLEAALADPAAAEAVRSGTLVRALSFAGFGGVDVDGAVAVVGSRPPTARGRSDVARSAQGGGQKAAGAQGDDPAAAGGRTAGRRRRTAAAEERALAAAAALDDAVQACETAQRRADAAGEEQAELDRRREAAQAEVDDLEQRLSAARERLAEAGHRAHDAQGEADRAAQAADRARRRVAQAQGEAEKARAALDALRRS